jgi:hypothetical protein
MFGKMTPEEVLNSVVEGINAGDLDFLMTLYDLSHVLLLNQESLLKVQVVYKKACVVSLI